MIVLDTNIVSKAMKPEPSPTVLAWRNEQVAETLYLSSVTLAELLFGIAALPTGRSCKKIKMQGWTMLFYPPLELRMDIH